MRVPTLMWGHSERVFPKPFPEIRNLHFRFGGMSISLYAQMRENANPRPEAQLSYTRQPSLQPAIWVSRYLWVPKSVAIRNWALTEPQTTEQELRQGCSRGRRFARSNPNPATSVELLSNSWSPAWTIYYVSVYTVNLRLVSNVLFHSVTLQYGTRKYGKVK